MMEVPLSSSVTQSGGASCVDNQDHLNKVCILMHCIFMPSTLKSYVAIQCNIEFQ